MTLIQKTDTDFEMTSLYEQAEKKVANSESLNNYRDFILADWGEGNEHWQWVLDSSDEEIIDWVESCQG